MEENLNKQELRDLEKYGYKLSSKDPDGLIVSGLVVISNGNKDLHDSGYPFIKIFGVVGEELVSLGWHDHWISYVPTNTDSFGKNIFHVFPWMGDRKWKVTENFMSTSTFQIGEYNDSNNEFVILS